MAFHFSRSETLMFVFFFFSSLRHASSLFILHFPRFSGNTLLVLLGGKAKFMKAQTQPRGKIIYSHCECYFETESFEAFLFQFFFLVERFDTFYEADLIRTIAIFHFILADIRFKKEK